MSNGMNGTKYAFSRRVAADTPQEHIEYIIESAKRQAGNDLYGLLCSQKLPVVVDIEEKLISTPSDDIYNTLHPENEFRIIVTVTPVKYRDVVVANTLYAPPPIRGIDRLSEKIKRLARRLFLHK